MFAISNSVGRAGSNRPEDVHLIQMLLAGTPADVLPRDSVKVSDLSGDVLIELIEAFQLRAMRVVVPTGCIEPNSPTFLALVRFGSKKVELREAEIREAELQAA